MEQRKASTGCRASSKLGNYNKGNPNYKEHLMVQQYETAGISMYNKLKIYNDDAASKTIQPSESGHIWGNWAQIRKASVGVGSGKNIGTIIPNLEADLAHSATLR